MTTQHLLHLWHEATNGTGEVTPEALERFAAASHEKRSATMVCLIRQENNEIKGWIIGYDLNDLFRKMQARAPFSPDIATLCSEMYVIKDDIFFEQQHGGRRQLGVGRGLLGTYTLLVD